MPVSRGAAFLIAGTGSPNTVITFRSGDESRLQDRQEGRPHGQPNASRILSVAASAITVALLHAGEEHHWTCRGSTGPAKWAPLEHEYATCGAGRAQSPIDIEDSVAKKGDLPDDAPGSSITVHGKQYELGQFHFHKPIEERINGKPADMAAYYTFTGSLTTPPCSEGVTWFVLKARTPISKDELTRFAKLYPMNARPTQSLNGREIRATQ